MLHDQGLPKFLWGEATKPSPLYMFNIGARIKHWTSRHSKKFSPVRNLMFHFRIFGCPVYFPLLKDKRNKLDASGKKGNFVGYSETSKAYRIYVSGQREVEISHDVTFNEDFALGKFKDLPNPRKDNDDDVRKKDESPTDDLMPKVEGSMDPIDPPPSEPSTLRKRPLWLKDTLEDAARHVAPRGTFCESKKSNRY